MGHTGNYWKITKKTHLCESVTKCEHAHVEVCLKTQAACWTLSNLTPVICFIITDEDFKRTPGLGNGPLLKVIATISSQFRPPLQG